MERYKRLDERMIDEPDQRLIQIVDAAVAEASRRSGAWLKCRPGCSQCCMGPFEITALDAWRLRRGLERLTQEDPKRAERVRGRVAEYLNAGDTGDIEDAPCPVLDPASGCCDLYAQRPITCRVFGPPVRVDGESIGVCELCYEGASEAEIAGCQVDVDPDGVESGLIAEVERDSATGMTTVARALA